MIRYSTLIQDMPNPFNLRLEMMRFLRENSISETAREFETTRKTVRKWKERHQAHGLKGLVNQSRAPLSCPHKLSPLEEGKIQELKEKHSRWGPARLKLHYSIPWSDGAIYRVIKERGLLKTRRKKWRRRLDLREIKQKMRPFEKLQIDTKDLKDIPEYYPAMTLEKLPMFQYGARCMSTGAVFFAYANQNNSTYSALFAGLVISHLERYSVTVKEIEWQTDNGSEFIGNVRKKERSAFQRVLDEAGIHHTQIPPRHCTWQSDIERFNGLIEEELYMCEDFTDETDFLSKACAYQLFFNYYRKNSYRDNKTPIDILKEKLPEMDRQVLNFPPIRLERVLRERLQSGYHVPTLDTKVLLAF
jgi:transposase